MTFTKFHFFLFFFVSSSAYSQSAIMDTLTISGDIRYRYENIDKEGSVTRERQRVRARLGFTAKHSGQLEIRVGFATSENGNPVSENITLSGGASKKEFALSYAYFNYNLSDEMSIMGGKLINPWYRAGDQPLVFDSDLTPEGLALVYRKDNWFLSIVNFQLQENKSSTLDPQMFGGQFGLNFGKLVIGAGYQDYQDTQGSTPLYDGKSRGASLADGVYKYDYDISELFFQYTNDGLLDERIRVFGISTNNLATDDGDCGYLFGIQLGNASSPGTWRLGYSHYDIERNTVLSLYTDSDIGGGGTGKRGNSLEAVYVGANSVRYQLTYFDNEILNDEDQFIDYNRLHLSAQFSF
jgi:hypothetical protein